MGKLVQMMDPRDDQKVYPYPGFPVGAIYMSMNNTNPSNYFGGTWSLIAPGKVLVGVDTSQTEFNTVRKSGGAKTHQLTIAEMPNHNHNILLSAATPGVGNQVKIDNWSWSTNNQEYNGTIRGTGGSGSHNNLQPYLTCYIWERTA